MYVRKDNSAIIFIVIATLDLYGLATIVNAKKSICTISFE